MSRVYGNIGKQKLVREKKRERDRERGVEREREKRWSTRCGRFVEIKFKKNDSQSLFFGPVRVLFRIVAAVAV